MRFRPVAIIGLLVMPLAVEGQVSAVRGVASDPTSGAPLAGVIVALIPDGETTPADAVLTDATGRFVVEGEIGSEYRLLAERVGLTSVRTDLFRLPSKGEFWLEMPVQAVAIEGV